MVLAARYPANASPVKQHAYKRWRERTLQNHSRPHCLAAASGKSQPAKISSSRSPAKQRRIQSGQNRCHCYLRYRRQRSLMPRRFTGMSTSVDRLAEMPPPESQFFLTNTMILPIAPSPTDHQKHGVLFCSSAVPAEESRWRPPCHISKNVKSSVRRHSNPWRTQHVCLVLLRQPQAQASTTPTVADL